MLDRAARRPPREWDLVDPSLRQVFAGSVGSHQGLPSGAFNSARTLPMRRRREVDDETADRQREPTTEGLATGNRILGLAERIASQSSATTQVLVRRVARGALLSRMKEASQTAAVENWDGYGAHAALSDALKHAERFALLLPATLPDPDPSIDSDGAMAFEWYRGPTRVFSVSVGTDGSLHYAGLFGANKTYGVESFAGQIPEPIALGIARVVGGPRAL